MFVVKGERRRRLHKALLRYHDPAGWPMIREALLEMGKGHLIGNGPDCLVPPEGRGEAKAERSRNKGLKPALTRHSAITHQRSNGAGNKAGCCGQVRLGSLPRRRQGGQWQASRLPAQQRGWQRQTCRARGSSRQPGRANPPIRARRRPALALPSRVPNPLTQGGKPAAKGNGAKRPAR